MRRHWFAQLLRKSVTPQVATAVVWQVGAVCPMVVLGCHLYPLAVAD